VEPAPGGPSGRFPLQGGCLPFEEIGEIRIQRIANSPSDQTSDGPRDRIEMQNRWDAELLRPRSSLPARAFVTIITARGNAMALGDLLRSVGPDDLDEFVGRIEALRPGLVRTSS
jgi:hypothetical protein